MTDAPIPYLDPDRAARLEKAIASGMIVRTNDLGLVKYELTILGYAKWNIEQMFGQRVRR